MVISASHTARMRLMSRVASSEWPPRRKKWSSMVADGSPSTAAKSPHSTSSAGVRGARPALSVLCLGAGSARRSILPLVVSGSASRTTNADGTMYSGRAAETSRCTSSASSCTSCAATR